MEQAIIQAIIVLFAPLLGVAVVFSIMWAVLGRLLKTNDVGLQLVLKAALVGATYYLTYPIIMTALKALAVASFE